MTVLAAAAAPALAQSPPSITVPILGHFRSVLAQGEGTQLNGADFLQYQASGNPPASYTSQTPLYVGSELHATSFQPSDLDTYYKPTDFGSMPGGVGSVESPRAASRSSVTSSSAWRTSTATRAQT